MRLKIIAFSNYYYREVALNWVKHIERLGIENYEIICTDRACCRYLRKSGVKARLEQRAFRWHYFKHYGRQEAGLHFKILTRNLLSRKHSERTDPTFGGKERWPTLWRLAYIKGLLEKGNDVIVSDVDTIWLKNPVEDLFAGNSEDIVAHRAFGYPPKFKQKYGYVPCMGWVGFRSNPQVIDFLGRVLLEGEKQKAKSDQRSFNCFLMSRNPDVRKSDLGDVFIADDVRILVLRKELIRRREPTSAETYVWHPYVDSQDPEAKKQALGDRWLV